MNIQISRQSNEKESEQLLGGRFAVLERQRVRFTGEQWVFGGGTELLQLFGFLHP